MVELRIGEGFGILLTEEERRISYRTVKDRLLPYLRQLYAKRADYKVLEAGGVDAIIMVEMMLTSLIDEGIEEDAPLNYLYYKLLCPQQEFGSRRFFGYIGSNRAATTIDYCFIVLLRHACEVFPSRIQINDGYEFAFALPSPEVLTSPDPAKLQKFEIEMGTINMFKPYLRRRIKELGEVWIPHPRLIATDTHLIKAMIERGKDLEDEDRSYFFNTETECKAFLDRHYRRHDHFSTYYQSAWQFIKTVYPDVPLDRVKRYLVGWWG